MNRDFNVEIIGRETIKPSSPTPSHLRHGSSNPTICDDRGALFVEAKVNCTLSEILDDPDANKLQYLTPCRVNSTQALTGYLVLAQVNLFECGGMALALSISHKLADGFTNSTFMNRWSANAALADHHVPNLPRFDVAASLYPPQDFLNTSKRTMELVQGEKCSTRRFLFDASRIAALKLKAASDFVPNPTSTEVVSALIWQCAMEASSANLGSIRPSSWRQAVNIRRSGQTENLPGNLVWYFEANTRECDQLDLQSLVATLRKCKDDYKVNYPDGVTAEDVCQSLRESKNNFGNEGIDDYGCTSVCRLPFYETNFGWGKPSWVTNCGADFKNVVTLMDAHDGKGIDASLTFVEEDMAIFEGSISKVGAVKREGGSAPLRAAGKAFVEVGKRYFSSEARARGAAKVLFSFINTGRRGRFL